MGERFSVLDLPSVTSLNHSTWIILNLIIYEISIKLTPHPKIFDESALSQHGEKEEVLIVYTIKKYICFSCLKSMESSKPAINLFFTYKPKGNSNSQWKLKSSVFLKKRKKFKMFHLQLKKIINNIYIKTEGNGYKNNLFTCS